LRAAIKGLTAILHEQISTIRQSFRPDAQLRRRFWQRAVHHDAGIHCGGCATAPGKRCGAPPRAGDLSFRL